jgi:hypothetical protein
MRIFKALAAVTAALAMLISAAPAHAAADAAQTATGITRVSVYHQAVTPTNVSGSGIGTVRTFLVPIAVNGKAANGQYMTGTLTTLATGLPGNQEIRSANLTFVFGDDANQIVLGGTSLYPAAGATIAVGTKTIRPILGGSGTYAGARGEVVSTNLGADGWMHVFLLKR